MNAEKRTTKNHPPMEARDACIAMHTALRKLADSTTSSNMYQVISLVSDLKVTPHSLHPWLLFGRLVAAEKEHTGAVLRRIGLDLEEAHWHACETWSKSRTYRDDAMTVRNNGHQALWALICGFRLLSEDDWDVMASFLEDE